MNNSNPWTSGEEPGALPNSLLSATTDTLPRDSDVLFLFVCFSFTFLSGSQSPLTDKNGGYPRTELLVYIHQITLG